MFTKGYPCIYITSIRQLTDTFQGRYDIKLNLDNIELNKAIDWNYSDSNTNNVQ